MPHHPILVRRITHLTDARYFAAMGVDWMSIEITTDQISFDRWHAIRDWVEGVKLAAEIDARNDELLARVLIEALPDGLIFESDPVIELQTDIPCFYMAGNHEGDDIPYRSPLIVPYHQIGTWKALSQSHAPDAFFLEADWTQLMVREVLATGYLGGFCFLGGDEEKKGIKDFSLMDDMITLLRS